MGTAYTAWTGIDAVGTFAVGVAVLDVRYRQSWSTTDGTGQRQRRYFFYDGKSQPECTVWVSTGAERPPRRRHPCWTTAVCWAGVNRRRKPRHASSRSCHQLW